MSCSFALKDYISGTLIETGSASGNGIENGLKFGFGTIHSIEIDPVRYVYCAKRFKDNLNIHLHLGDSAKILPVILDGIKDKCTILLDAHVTSYDEMHSENICPLIAELECIMAHSKLHNIRHFVIIDDAKYLQGNSITFNRLSIEDIKKVIEPKYTVQANKRYIVLT